MHCVGNERQGRLIYGRAAMARERIAGAMSMLSDCHFCAHHCGVNRLAGEMGLCHADARSRFFLAQTEVTDELELVPTFAVALSGCDLRCDFCITGAESWNPRAGSPFSADEMVQRAERALEEGARTIMILGGEPTIHLHSVLEFVARLRDDALLVWKTNAHGSAQARQLLDGLFDFWVADYKFGNDRCAQRLAKVPHYTKTIRENLLWAAEHSELIIRHLVMPGHIECCWRSIAEWISDNLPGVKVNLRTGFWPAWRSRWHQELRAAVSADENACAQRIAQICGLNLVP